MRGGFKLEEVEKYLKDNHKDESDQVDGYVKQLSIKYPAGRVPFSTYPAMDTGFRNYKLSIKQEKQKIKKGKAKDAKGVRYTKNIDEKSDS